MNILSTNNPTTFVSLQELVPQHDCLKLLILHTPYTLQIDTLPLCTNLVKLDLSKNNLETFPYLGQLNNLRFMFLHQNKLGVKQLKGIFEVSGQKSILSEKIVWVTFWGNKNSFLGRHYLINQTSAIAVDQNMVAEEQRNPSFSKYKSEEAFSKITDLSQYFKKKTVNRHASEQEYMAELWEQMRGLRKKHEKIVPIIKIQKMVRGWKLRHSYQKAKEREVEKIQIQSLFFSEWKYHVRKNKKLERLITKKHLLTEGRQGRIEEICYKMVEWSKRAKQRVALKKGGLINQYRFFNSLKSNFDQLKCLYKELHLQKCSSIYILQNDWNLFRQVVIPFAQKFNNESVLPLENSQYILRYICDISSSTTKQMLRILAANFKSLAFENRRQKDVDIRLMRRGRKNLLYGIGLKSIYREHHFTTKKLLSIKEKMEQTKIRHKFSLQEMIKIEGNQRMLKDLVRGIYFFNIRVFPESKKVKQRINVFSQVMLKRISSATKIQKVWRGFQLRKKHEFYLRELLKMQRAAIIIQRWVKRLPLNRKKQFIFLTSKRLETIHDEFFYIELSDYLNFIEIQGDNWKKEQNENISFLQQLSRVYLDRTANILVLDWNHQSEDVQIHDNLRVKKHPFSNIFYKERIGLTDDQISAKIGYNKKKHEKCDVSHIFHYETKTNLIKKNNKKFLEIKCSSRSQARFRCLILKLLTYQPKKKHGMKIFASHELGHPQSIVKIQPATNGVSFICNQDASLIKMCQEKISEEKLPNVHIITNKFYVSKNESKPLRNEERFYIFSTQNPKIKQKQTIVEIKSESKHERRYRTQASQHEERSHLIFTDIGKHDTQVEQKSIAQQKLKKILNKRSMKQFKIDKRIKNRRHQQQPSFILDSISINDRLTTQPQILKTQPSNIETNVRDTNVRASHRRQKSQVEMGVHRNQSQESYHHAKSLDKKPKIGVSNQRIISMKKKQDENWTKRFVNLGNFIQSQFANDYRRKQRTQSHYTAIESAQSIKRSIERSHSERVEKIQEKLKEVKQKHSQHRQNVQKHEISLKDQAEKLKHFVSEQRQKKAREKNKARRLKVSFAEECYPLGRNKQQEFLS